MESVLAGSLDNVLVRTDTSGLESFRRELLVLVRDKVAAEGEVVDGGTLTTEVVDADLGVRDLINTIRRWVRNEETTTCKDERAEGGIESTTHPAAFSHERLGEAILDLDPS